ncbi:ABC transporter family protein [Saccharothrix texasensis]|uniref:ABC transporter family protein n=1 Tax=Saccharothrix texasensis TaxID=103734 RepID=A0A3N1GZ35_9PSEU|nr:ABC transporter family protein [Saccharothrix texasensis]
MSGGERSRLAPAATPASAPELLLLDEPTNHLSPGLVEDLDRALADYPGALVVVTHDRRTRAGQRRGGQAGPSERMIRPVANYWGYRA